jgi:hypothetical protein
MGRGKTVRKIRPVDFAGEKGKNSGGHAESNVGGKPV